MVRPQSGCSPFAAAGTAMAGDRANSTSRSARWQISRSKTERRHMLRRSHAELAVGSRGWRRPAVHSRTCRLLADRSQPSPFRQRAGPRPRCVDRHTGVTSRHSWRPGRRTQTRSKGRRRPRRRQAVGAPTPTARATARTGACFEASQRRGAAHGIGRWPPRRPSSPELPPLSGRGRRRTPNFRHRQWGLIAAH